MSKRGLGKGLQALIPEIEISGNEEITQLSIDEIRPNARQPRKTFTEEKLRELANSIKEHGIVQPILVRPRDAIYEIVAGERRWRAAQLAGLQTVPAIIKEFTNAQMMEIALIENLQREDLNPIEEAEAYHTLMNEFGLTQEKLSERLGKSRPQVANTLRLLQLPAEIRRMLSAEEITMGHGRALLAVKGEQEQLKLARRVVRENLSVREVEEIVRSMAQPHVPRETKKIIRKREPLIEELEEKLKKALGTKVIIKPGKKKGKIEIEYYTGEDLERFMELLSTTLDS